MALTRPDPDRLVDRDAIDEHACKLVAEKLQREPLSPAELLGVILAVTAVILVLMLALAAQK